MSEESKSSTLPSKEVEELVAYALHAAASDGLLHGSAGAAKHVPLTLTPAKVRCECVHVLCVLHTFKRIFSQWMYGTCVGWCHISSQGVHMSLGSS